MPIIFAKNFREVFFKFDRSILLIPNQNLGSEFVLRLNKKILFILFFLSIFMAGMQFQYQSDVRNGYPRGSLVYHASSSGNPTLDSDTKGGNPFATAFIEQLSKRGINLKQFNKGLIELTHKYSNGFQKADVPKSIRSPDWIVTPVNRGSKRIALVIILSDYSMAKNIGSLPGAKFDSERVVTALRKAGYDTNEAPDLNRTEFLNELADFNERSRKADAAIIYTTGHGGEFDNKIYLIAGDYPINDGTKALKTHAYPLSRIASAANAKTINMVFYAGCRDQPF